MGVGAVDCSGVCEEVIYVLYIDELVLAEMTLSMSE